MEFWQLKYEIAIGTNNWNWIPIIGTKKWNWNKQLKLDQKIQIRPKNSNWTKKLKLEQKISIGTNNWNWNKKWKLHQKIKIGTKNWNWNNKLKLDQIRAKFKIEYLEIFHQIFHKKSFRNFEIDNLIRWRIFWGWLKIGKILFFVI